MLTSSRRRAAAGAGANEKVEPATEGAGKEEAAPSGAAGAYADAGAGKAGDDDAGK